MNNSISAADSIRLKQHYRHLLAETVESLKFYFQLIAKNTFGEECRFIVLTDISSINKIGRTGLQLVTATFNTELGELTLTLAIKEFSTPNEAYRNMELTNLLKKRLSKSSRKELKNLNISTPEVIYHFNSTLIYEGIKGKTFSEVIEDEDKSWPYQLTGQALAKYHSKELKSAKPRRYLFLLKSVVDKLPIPAEYKKLLINLAADQIAKLPFYNVGTASFGDFHGENIMFSVEEKLVKTWLIDPEFVEKEKKADRMEDIATFFLHKAIDIYKNGKDFNIMKKEFLWVIDGYNEYLNRFELSVDQIYESKEIYSFKFHLGLNALLEALFTINNDPENFERIKDCLGLTNHLWSKAIFQ